jgi:hypothetical protein
MSVIGLWWQGLSKFYERLAFANRVTDRDFDLADFSGLWGEDERVHLHCLKGEQMLSFFNVLPGFHHNGSNPAR